MTQEELNRFYQFAPLYNLKHITASYIAELSGITPRHARRLLKNTYPTTRAAHNRISDEKRAVIIDLKRERPERNCQWIAEMAGECFEHQVSQSTVWRVLKEAGSLNAPIVKRVARSRFEAASTGDLVQMDTSWGYWLGGERVCLILLLDDYSRFILHAEFFWQDSAYNNMSVITEVLQNYGSFKILYTDNASFFKAIRHGKSFYQVHSQTEYESEITKACREVGITHLTHKPYQPQSKGKIERLFRFIQERFVTQIEPSWDLERLNSELLKWVDWYNRSHKNRTTGCTPKERFDPKGFSPLSAERNLADIFCHKCTRKVDSCNQFSFEGINYTIPSEHCMVAYKVELCIHPFICIRVLHQGKFVCELPMPLEEISKHLDEKKRKRAEKQQWKAYFEYSNYPENPEI